MPPALDHRLNTLRRRLRQTLLAYGLGWTAAVLVGTMLAACLADWALHFDDSGVRLILCLAILAGGAWVAWRRLVAPLCVSFSDVDLALRIEERYPGFRDSLASSVQFAAADAGDERVGSVALQRAVVRDTLARLETIAADDVIETRQSWRVATLALAVCAVALLVALAGGANTAIALERLLLPFSSTTWPKQTSLRLLNAQLEPLPDESTGPLRAARGESLKLFAENTSGRLPEKLILEYRVSGGTSGGESIADTMRPLSMKDASGRDRELAFGQLPTARGDLMFRAVGGDDATPWRRLEVAPPPVIESLQVRLTPPAYLHRNPENRPEGSGHVEGSIGTKIDIIASANKALASAGLRVKDQPALPVQISDGGRTITSSFIIVEPGVYTWWFELVDAQGFENPNPARYEVRGIADAVPEIRIETPAADALVTADAELLVRTSATDDLGISSMRLVFARDGEIDEPRPAAGQAAGAAVPGAPSGQNVIPLFDGAGRPLEQTVDYPWQLAELKLTAGMRIVFRTEATDDFDLSDVFPPGQAPPPHIGKSVSRILRVVSPAEKLQELTQQQAGLLDDLERAFRLEKQSHDQVEDLRHQLRNTGKLRSEDLDSLQRAELGQREATGQLTHPAQGLGQRAGRLLDDLHRNHIDEPATERRLSEMAEELDRLGQNHLPAIEHELTQARKLAQSRTDQDNATTESALGKAASQQREVLDSLAELLRNMSQWRSEQEAARELSELAHEQSELNRRTDELSQETLSKSRETLSPQERADLDKLTERQRRHAERLDQFQSRIENNLSNGARDGSAASSQLKETLERSRELGISEQMRDAAGQIGENRMGAAARSQAQVSEKLREIEKTLTNEPETDAETLVKQLKQTESDLERLVRREEETLRKTREAQQIQDAGKRQAELDRLEAEQREIQDETSRLTRKLARLQAQRAADSARRAAGRMQQAQQELDEADDDEARENQQAALDDLEQAQRELARERRRAEERLAREQLEKIADQLQAMIVREQAVIDETRRLEEIRREAGRFTRSQFATLRDLTATQRTLREETQALSEKLTAAEVFGLALRGAAARMQQAADLLDERLTGDETQSAEEAARKRFVELIAALKDEDQPRRPNQPPQEGEGGQRRGGPQGESIPPIAQLKMLLSLQRDLLERTEHLQKLREKTGALTPEQQRALEAVSGEQAELADLARNLSQIATESDDDEPDRSGPDRKQSPPDENPAGPPGRGTSPPKP